MTAQLYIKLASFIEKPETANRDLVGSQRESLAPTGKVKPLLRLTGFPLRLEHLGRSSLSDKEIPVSDK